MRTWANLWDWKNRDLFLKEKMVGACVDYPFEKRESVPPFEFELLGLIRVASFELNGLPDNSSLDSFLTCT